MQKTSFVLALVLILGCVSAVNFTESSWKVQPKLVISNGTNDTTFLHPGNVLVSSSANNTLSLLNVQSGTTYNQRIFNLKDLGKTNGNDSVVTMDLPDAKVRTFIGDFALSADVIGTLPQQVRLTVTPYNGGAAAHYNLTKNLDNSTNFAVSKVFAHKGRYYIVYSDSGSNYNISGADANGANVNTVVLTTNASHGSVVDCVGLSGKDSAYCLFVYQNGTDQSLFEATVGLKGDNTKAPDAKAFDVNATGLPQNWIAYNAGKQYGGYFMNAAGWFFRNNNNATVASLNHTASAGSNLAPSVAFAYNDDIVLIWASIAANTQSYSTQHIDVNGKFTDADLVSDVDNFVITQYKDGSLYVVAGNSSDLYLGQVWGSTNMFASTLQSVFAIVLAAIAALFLF